MDADSDVALDILITNVVCVFRTRCHLNLRKIALEGANVIYKRDVGKVLMKLRKPRITATIWSSGKVICTGATSEEEAKFGARRLARSLQKLGFQFSQRHARFQAFSSLLRRREDPSKRKGSTARGFPVDKEEILPTEEATVEKPTAFTRPPGCERKEVTTGASFVGFFFGWLVVVFFSGKRRFASDDAVTLIQAVAEGLTQTFSTLFLLYNIFMTGAANKQRSLILACVIIGIILGLGSQ